jgi:hypothetical protein
VVLTDSFFFGKGTKEPVAGAWIFSLGSSEQIS